MVCTLAAEGPFGPSCAWYWTFAPSSSDLKPLPAIAEWWTNRSLPDSSGVMKPKPLSLLNHLTVPVGMAIPPVWCCDARRMLVQPLTANREHCLLAPDGRPATDDCRGPGDSVPATP